MLSAFGLWISPLLRKIITEQTQYELTVTLAQIYQIHSRQSDAFRILTANPPTPQPSPK